MGLPLAGRAPVDELCFGYRKFDVQVVTLADKGPENPL